MKLIKKHPEIAAEWIEDKNFPLILSSISYGSRKKVWWMCNKCNHSYQMRVDSRSGKGCGCPVCNSNRKTVPLNVSNPELAKEWHKKNELSPNDVTAGSHDIVWWSGVCGHEWQANIHNRTKLIRPAGCPYCCNKLVDNTNSLKSCFPNIANEWHPTKNENFTPDDVVWCAYKKVWWLGECGHEWNTLVRTRTRKIRPAGCPVCKDSKGEIAVEKELVDLGICYRKQVRFKNCRSKYPLPFDFEIVGKNILIEYQGIQHYEPTNFGGDFLKVFTDLQEHDRIKREWCEDNSYKLIAIPYHQIDDIKNIILREVYHP